MELVGAGLGDHIDDRTGEVAVFRVKGAGLQTKFLDRIENGNGAGAIGAVVFHDGPVDHERIGVFTLTIDGEQAGSEIAGSDNGGLKWAGIANGGNAGLQPEKVEI